MNTDLEERCKVTGLSELAKVAWTFNTLTESRRDRVPQDWGSAHRVLCIERWKRNNSRVIYGVRLYILCQGYDHAGVNGTTIKNSPLTLRGMSSGSA
jgi:hypothetical protein